MDKNTTKDIFVTISEKIAGMPVSEAYEHLGAAIGLIALALEREHGVDRNATFKMLQRYGHATIKQLEQTDD